MASGFSLKEIGRGFKSILSRNAILIMLFYILNMYSTYFKNGFRTLVVMNEVGLSATVVGTMISLFLAVGLITRTPAGSLVDNNEDKIKPLLIIAGTLKALSCLCYTYFPTAGGMWFSFVFDAIVWSFVGVASPAVLAKSVDKKAMGTAYAIFEGLMNVITASARPLGAQLFAEMGSRNPAWIAFAIQIVAVLLVLFMDGSKFAENTRAIQEKVAEKKAEKAAPTLANQPSAKKKSFLGLSMVALPLALLNGAQYIMYNMDANFSAAFAQLNGFDYTTPATLGGSIFGVMTIVIGLACDFMSPTLLIGVAFIGQCVAPFVLASAASQSVFATGIMIYFLTRYYTMPLKILAMKKAPAADQGKVQGTILFAQDFFSIIATTLCGALIDNVGYDGTFTFLGFFGAALFVVFVLYTLYTNKKEKAAQA